jgi:type IV secretory pathway TrbD component
MTFRTIIVLVLRFYSVLLVVSRLVDLPGLYLIGRLRKELVHFPVLIALPVFYLIAGIIVWILADWIASRMTREFNPSIQFQMTLREVSALAFAILGFYFVIKSVGPFISAAFLVGLRDTHTHLGDRSSDNFVALLNAGEVAGLCNSAITLGLGLALLFLARVCARRLASSDGGS